ncbi:MAG: hypothetical protein A2V77_02755 [Anaeromyxobacter sp. RBG_16_69_14]|nr:MAG: hypothetical protein A2V77_02755 [Anaeromyxobacter sp. RBG_16_69_14]HJW74104.1 hypothetical protein [Thermoleophilia bacterium]
MNVKSLAAALACLTVAGCADDATKKTYGDTYSLTVFAYDGETGAPIPSAALATGLALYEGVDKVQPVVLDTTLAGAAIFEDVPADYAAGNKVFPIIASVAGYQPFQGEVTFATADENEGDSLNTLPRDDLFAQVGYIQLWPVNFHAPDYTYTVVYNGKPVPNATVKFAPGDESKGFGNNTKPNVITPTSSVLVPAHFGTTDANGNVTFAGANLILGAAYTVEVLPVVFEGVQLAAKLGNAGNPVTVGSASSIPEVIELSTVDLVPGSNIYGLYVKSISNSVANQYDPANAGTLTIVFSRPVDLHATAPNQTFGVAVTGSAATFQAIPVAATLSTDKLTLTLKPNWLAAPVATDYGAYITYSDNSAFVTVVGYPEDPIYVFAELSSAAGAINGKVFVEPLQ